MVHNGPVPQALRRLDLYAVAHLKATINTLTMVVNSESRRWYQIRWFAPQDTPEERTLIVKLDLLIVPYAFLAYWTKYLDQANISKSSNQTKNDETYS